MLQAHPGFADAPQDCIIVPHENECIAGARYHAVTALPTEVTVKRMNQFALLFAPLVPRGAAWDTRKVTWGGRVRPAIFARMPGAASSEEFKMLVESMKNCLFESGLAVKFLTCPMGPHLSEDVILD